MQGRVRTAHAADVKNLVDDLKAVRPTFVLAVPRVFEKVYNAAKQRAHADGKGAIFDLAERVAIAYSEALDRPGRVGLPLRLRARPVRPAGVHQAARRARRTTVPRPSRVAPRSVPGSAHFFRGIGMTIYEGYGLTETSPACAVNLPGHIRIGTVGRPLPGVSIRIADDGEILIGGDIVFRGYWHNDPATAEAKDADGWFHTGDLGQPRR